MSPILQSVGLAFVLTATLSAADVSLTGSNLTPATGTTFSVTVSANSVPNSTSWGIFLRFDPVKVRLVSQDAPSSASALGGALNIFLPDTRGSAINSTGEVRAAGFTNGSGVSGAGILGVFTFQAVNPGAATIRTEILSASNIFGDNFLIGSTETIPNIGAPVSLTISGASTLNRAIKVKEINGYIWDCIGESVTLPVGGIQTISVPSTKSASLILKQTSPG